MLTSIHFTYLAITFVISVLLGIILRILYNSKTLKNGHVRLINVLILIFVFPIIAYKDLSKHKTDYIRKVNNDSELTERQKYRLRKRLSSNRKIAIFVIINSIRRFKRNLDSHIEFLNAYKDKYGHELKISFSIKVEFKRNSEEKDFYEDNIRGLFA